MHFATAFLALAAIAQAAPVSLINKPTPDHYAEGYLEDYAVYHTRYINIGCSGQQGTQFFKDCCSPMLAIETLEANRLPYCRPNATESATPVSSAAEAEATTDIEDHADDEYCAESEAVESYVSQYSALPSASSISTSAEAVHTTPAAAVEQAARPTSTSEWVAPTTSEAPAPVETPKEETPAPSGGDVKTGGYATYFYQNGNAGACGQHHSDGELGIAIDSNGYWGNDFSSGSDYCGRQIHITNNNNGQSVVATVWDVCPSCSNGQSLDLSVGAFQALGASLDQGMFPISWSFV